MARKPRFNVPGMPCHIVQRGNNRQACFFGEGDYRWYRESLREATEKAGCVVHAYVLMTNHAHLLATPEVAGGVAVMMQSVGRRYVRYTNDVYGRSGTLWEGRYKASLVQSERYLLTVYRYIEMNPVRASMTAHPSAYRWSSHRYNAFGAEDEVVEPHAEYLRLGQDDEARQGAYRHLFAGHLSSETLDEIRGTTQENLVLGDSRFKDEIERMTERRARRGQPGRPRRAHK